MNVLSSLLNVGDWSLLLGHIVVWLRMLALRAGMVGLVVSLVCGDGNVGMLSRSIPALRRAHID